MRKIWRRGLMVVAIVPTFVLAVAITAPAASADPGTVKAQDLAFTAAEGTPLSEPSASLEIGSSDTDPNTTAECCDATLGVAPANGTAVVNTDGSFTYTPDAGFWGRTRSPTR